MEYTLIRSNRKTLSIHIENDGSIKVNAPKFLSVREIERFLLEKEDWIINAKAKIEKKKQKLDSVRVLTPAEIKSLRKQANALFPYLANEYANFLKVNINSVTIKKMKSRWGSCTKDGNLNFNIALMMAPERVIRYVIVHEVCHRIEMNHSERFWKLVASIIPDYKLDKKWLKENGDILIRRIGK